MPTAHSLAIEIDRSLSLSLSNHEFELLAEFIGQSDDIIKTALYLTNCGERIVRMTINECNRKLKE